MLADFVWTQDKPFNSWDYATTSSLCDQGVEWRFFLSTSLWRPIYYYRYLVIVSQFEYHFENLGQKEEVGRNYRFKAV